MHNQQIKKEIDAKEDGYYLEIESYLNRVYIQYKSAVTLLDVIGSIYANDESRNALRSIERIGPTNLDQYQTFKQCMLSSQHVRDFYMRKYDIEMFYNAIKNISFHDPEININDDGKYRNDPNGIGLFLKHGTNNAYIPM